MELGTLIGMVGGTLLILISIIMTGEAIAFLDPTSAITVIGGAIMATFIALPFKKTLSMVQVVMKAFFGPKIDYINIIEVVIDLAKKARREGLLAVDKEVGKIENPFLKTGMELVVDGTEPELIRTVMETELSYMMDRHTQGQGMMNTMGANAPAFGMIGTLMGLVAMLQNLDDPAAIGPGMALALLTTFYGAVIANLIFLPLATKLNNLSSMEILEKELVIEGVLAIQFGEHPNTISRKLLNFIEPKMREGYSEEEK